MLTAFTRLTQHLIAWAGQQGAAAGKGRLCGSPCAGVGACGEAAWVKSELGHGTRPFQASGVISSQTFQPPASPPSSIPPHNTTQHSAPVKPSQRLSSCMFEALARV